MPEVQHQDDETYICSQSGYGWMGEENIIIEIERVEYSHAYIHMRKKIREKAIARMYPVWNYNSIISKYLIEDIVFDNYLT